MPDPNDEPDGSCKSDIKSETEVDDPIGYEGACEGNAAQIEDDSCVGEQVCFENKKPVGQISCIGSRACYQNDGRIRSGSCGSESAWLVAME